MLPIKDSLVSRDAAISLLNLFSSLSTIAVPRASSISWKSSKRPKLIVVTFHVASCGAGDLLGFPIDFVAPDW